MNWFERYGIVGAFFLIIISILLFINGYFYHNISLREGAAIAAMLTAATIPVGYILSTLSMLLYYCGFNGKQIHAEAMKYIPEPDKKNFDINESDREHMIEAKMTFKFRSSLDRTTLEYLMMFGTKRWDVLAVNSALKISVIILVLFDFIIKFFKNRNFCFCFIEMWILLGFAILLIILVICDNILSEQLIEINKKLALEMKEITKSDLTRHKSI